jgi:hypothetical protein
MRCGEHVADATYLRRLCHFSIGYGQRMDPRTFLPPRATAAAPPPSVGEPARALPLVLAGPTVVSFLRHVGCPFAEAT